MTRPSSGIIRTSRLAAAALAAGIVLSGIAAPLPASAAAPIDVADWAELQSAVDTCTDGDVIRFAWAAPLYVTSNPFLYPACDLTLDLAGRSLYMEFGSIGLARDKTLTIRDSSSPSTGVLTVLAPNWGSIAAIQTTRATLVIESGHIRADGRLGAAGIGGSGASDTAGISWGGTVIITGGVVEAYGNGGAAGIGGGWGGIAGFRGAGGTVTIGGNAVVFAEGGDGAADIGGGELGDGGDVTIGAGATVTTRGWSNAIGPGDGGTKFGSLQVDGTLNLGTNVNLIDGDGDEVTVGATGKILAGGWVAGGGYIVGSGQIANGGVIGLATDHVLGSPGVTVTGNNSLVTFDRVSGPDVPIRVFAPDFASGYRTIPTPIADHNWLRPDDSVFGSTTEVSGDETVVEAVLIDVASWAELGQETQDCVDGDTLRVTADINSDLGPLYLYCDLTIDLNGHTVNLGQNSVSIASFKTFTIRDSSSPSTGVFHVVAPPSGGAGIHNRLSTLVVESGTVEAYGWGGGAGIGSHDAVLAVGDPYGGIVDIRGGFVKAVGSEGAAGIGGGAGSQVVPGGHGGDVTISGDAVVWAEAGEYAAAIGGGDGAAGGSLTIGPDATVYANGLNTVGAGDDGTEFGSLELSGTLVLPDGGNLEVFDGPGTEVTIAPGGLLRGGALTATGTVTGNPLLGSNILGDGQLVNNGVIALSASRALAGDVEITGNNSLVTFERVVDPDEQIRVFAPDFATGYRTIPTPLAWHNWVRSDESVLVAASALSGDETVVESVLPAVVDDPAELIAATGADCVPVAGYVVTLTADLGPTDADLPIACDLELDLAGHDLDLGDGSVKLTGGVTLTVTDSSSPSTGSLSAAGGAGEAGIRITSATLVVSSGTVSAVGGSSAAGIGGDSGGDGGTLVIDGGTVTTSGWNAIGHGQGGTSFGTVTVAGALRLPSGEFRMLDSAPGAELTVAAGGVIVGTSGDLTDGPQFSGAGQLANAGIITLSADRVLGSAPLANTIEVTGNHFLVRVGGSALPAVRVFAPALADGHRALPATPTRSGFTFHGWRSAPSGGGSAVDTVTALTTIATALAPADRGAAAQVTLYPKWVAVPATPPKATPAPTPATSSGTDDDAEPTPTATPEPTVEPIPEPSADPEPDPAASDDPDGEPTASADDPTGLPVGWFIGGGIVLLLIVAGAGILLFRRIG